MTTTVYVPHMEAQLDRKINTLKREMESIRSSEAARSPLVAAEIRHGETPKQKQFSEENVVEKLDQELARLEQIRQWLSEEQI